MPYDFIAGLVLLLLGTAATAQHVGHDHAAHQKSMVASRQADVAARGAGVMPFDSDRSTHVFERSTRGGTQSVVSKDGAPAQVVLIRAHLREEASAFSRGDYSSPASIHGSDMPGLSELARSANRIRVAYEPIANGGRIRFDTNEPTLASALHIWFDAQLADHGAHADHHMPPKP